MTDWPAKGPFLTWSEFGVAYDVGVRMSSDEIRQLTALWRQSAVTSQGGLAIGAQSEQYRLLRNNVRFHDLEYDELRTACLELTKLLLLPGANTVIDFDHLWLWSWYAQVLIGSGGSLSSGTDREIHQLAKVNTDAALAHANNPSPERFAQVRQANELLGKNARDFINSSHIALSYLCFPLLEAITRRACPAFLDLNGTVQQAFARSSGGSYRVASRCNNLGDVLRLLITEVADQDLQSDLSEVMAHVAAIAGSSDGCSATYVWRNSSLHGETTHQTIGGTIYTLSLMIALDSVKADYNSLRDAAVERVHHEQQSTMHSVPGYRPSWIYYPPYW